MSERGRRLEDIYAWLILSHADFPLEHDHHCLADDDGSVACSCGWTKAHEAMEWLDEQATTAWRDKQVRA